MGKLKYLFVAMLFAPLFMSCEEEGTVNMGKAAIEFDEAITEARVVEGVLTPAVSGSVTAPEGAVIESITVTVTYTDGENSIPLEIAGMSDMHKVNEGKYEFYYTEESDGISAVINDLTKIEIVAKVVDGESSSASVAVVFESATPTPLSADQSLTWFRHGSTITGLDKFGLKWASNASVTGKTGTWAIIKTDAAEKMVKLTADEWTTITTKEALEAAINSATALAQYDNVSAAASISNINDVLAVKKGDNEYYLIHIEKSVVGVSDTQGTPITVTGKYRDTNPQPAD